MAGRLFYWGEFLIVLALLGFAYYLQFYNDLVPCPLCELQRVIFAALGCLFLANAVLIKKRRRWVNVIIAVMAVLGMLIAARQVWLQFFPPEESVLSICDVKLSYLLQIMPWSDALLNILIGGPNCAKISWQFLHLSIAQWSLLWFGFFLIAALIRIYDGK
ncbi:MAG TPA: disulfide bond formation protein B [Gammaproteobacteria bacterium]|nr:disulfide bond formation protein B [Gammaproteobacteria bacterium]